MKPHPFDYADPEWRDGHLCRCTGNVRIRAATDAAGGMTEAEQ